MRMECSAHDLAYNDLCDNDAAVRRNDFCGMNMRCEWRMNENVACDGVSGRRLTVIGKEKSKEEVWGSDKITSQDVEMIQDCDEW
ncbi:Hypothetical predicted protein [Octopus vulgaris]|uniref:Uncharacterized protein n=1 Tax=Octopus vulgaris TaxID=6645 RepID=A0AA36F5F6_OCTVU|nr:Hypothetical predicted protein [Octopus vulgaris]